MRPKFPKNGMTGQAPLVDGKKTLPLFPHHRPERSGPFGLPTPRTLTLVLLVEASANRSLVFLASLRVGFAMLCLLRNAVHKCGSKMSTLQGKLYFKTDCSPLKLAMSYILFECHDRLARQSPTSLPMHWITRVGWRFTSQAEMK